MVRALALFVTAASVLPVQGEAPKVRNSDPGMLLTVNNANGLGNATDVNHAFKHFIAFPVSAPEPEAPARRQLDVTCSPFSASDTSGGSRNLPFCTISACPGDIITASMCSNGGYCAGDTVLSLVVQHADLSYWSVSRNDDLCGLCSGLTYTAPSDSVCQTYFLGQGCYSSESCGGQVQYSIQRSTSNAGSVPNTRANFLTQNGYIYSTLSDVNIDGYTGTCQSNPIALPSNWEIAPDTLEVKNIIAAHPWSTDVAVVSSGVGYRTNNFPPAGQVFGDSQSKFAQSGFMYWTPWCNYQILIRTRSPSPPSPASQSPTPSQNPSSLSDFSVSNTGNAKFNTQRIAIPRVCSDTTVTISTCESGGTFSGDSIIRLLAGDGTEIGNDDDSCALNGGSKLVYYTADSPCIDLTLAVGCFNDLSCSGRVSVRTSTGPPPVSSGAATSSTLAYSASDTNHAQQNVAVARFTQCGGSAITASTCASYTGDTYLRLRNSRGEVARNDDAGGTCGLGSSLSYQPPADAGCETYTLTAGCYSSLTCAGTVAYSYHLANDRGLYLSRGADGSTVVNGGYLFLLGRDRHRIGLSEIKISQGTHRLDNLGAVLSSTDYPFQSPSGDYYGSNSAFCLDGNQNSICSTDQTNSPWIMVDLTGRSWNKVELTNRRDCCTSDLASTVLAVAADPRGTQFSSWSYLDDTGSRAYSASFPLGSSSAKIQGSGGFDSALPLSPSSGCDRVNANRRDDRALRGVELTVEETSCSSVPDWSVSEFSEGFQAPGDPFSGFPASGQVASMTQEFVVFGTSQGAGSIAGRAVSSGLARNGVGAVVGTVVASVLNQQMPSAMDLVQAAVSVASPALGTAWAVADIVTHNAVSSVVSSFFPSVFFGGLFGRLGEARQLTDEAQLEWRVNITIALSSTALTADEQEAIANHLYSALRNATSNGQLSMLMPAVSQRLDISQQAANVTSIQRVGTFSMSVMSASQLRAQAHPVYRYVELSSTSSLGVGNPTTVPTTEPTTVPSAAPTTVPTTKPTPIPSAKPTPMPTAPTAQPTLNPTYRAGDPTPKPTTVPTVNPTPRPTTVPTGNPTSDPTRKELSAGAKKTPSAGFCLQEAISKRLIKATLAAAVATMSALLLFN